MRKLSALTLPVVALSVTLLAFVALAVWAAWTIDQVAHVTGRMEQRTELLRLAERWLDDERLAPERSEPDTRAVSSEARARFFSEARDEALIRRADDVVRVRRAWLDLRRRLVESDATAISVGERRQLQQGFSDASVEYIRVSQLLLNALMGDIYASGRTIRNLSLQLYLLGAGLLLSLIVFAFLLRLRVRHNARVRHEAQVAYFGSRFGKEIASQEEIGQLLQALHTIRE